MSVVSKRQVLEAVIRKTLIGENIDISQFPNPLPKDAHGETFLSKGLKDGNPNDDKVQAGAKQIPAAAAKPSQSAIYLGKSLGMAVSGIGKGGGNLGALISADNYILDGHHRWAATMFNNPDASVGGTGIDMPMNQLVPVLRAVGDAYGNARRGEPSGGDINIFKASLDDAKKLLQKIDGGTKHTKEGAASEWLKSLGGEQELANRLEAIKAKGSEAGSAPPRAEMPVIDADKGEDKEVATRLNKGAIDVKPPYAEMPKQGNKEPRAMEEQRGFKTTHDDDGDLLYVLPVQLTGDIDADVRAMMQDDEISKLLWGELGSDEGITDEAGQYTYWGSDVQDVVQGLHEILKLQENKIMKNRQKRVHNERYGLLMERMLGIKGLEPINSMGSRKNWLFEEEEDDEDEENKVHAYCPEESYMSAQEAEKEKEKIEDSGNWADSEIEKLMKHPDDLKND